MTPLDAETQRILKLAEGATPGPWVANEHDLNEWRIDAPGGDPTIGHDAWDGMALIFGCDDSDNGPSVAKRNAELIAAAPDMIQHIRSLSERLARVEEDAGRYLKLRDHLSVTQCAQALGKPHAMNPKDGWSREDWFDAVVDEAAAIRAGK